MEKIKKFIKSAKDEPSKEEARRDYPTDIKSYVGVNRAMDRIREFEEQGEELEREIQYEETSPELINEEMDAMRRVIRGRVTWITII